MKYLLTISLMVLLLTFANTPVAATITNNINAESSGGNSSVNVKVSNTSGTNTNSSSSSENSKTNVSIHNSGGGTSQVTVNGKEYKVEGTGDLEINENLSTSPTPDIESKSDGSSEEKIENEDNQSDSDTSVTPVPKQEKSEVSSPWRVIKDEMRNIKNSIKNFFAKIFSRKSKF